MNGQSCCLTLDACKFAKLKLLLLMGLICLWENGKRDRDPNNINCKRFHLQPILGTKEWKAAYSWLKVSFNWTIKKNIII